VSATATVADLAAEQAQLRAVLDGISATDWLRPTPAWGWDVRDTIAHLADTDEIAIDTMTGGPRALGPVRESSVSSEDTTYRGVLRGRRMTGAQVGAWWAEMSARELETIAALDPGFRVPWGLGMKTPSFISARLMETWAHGLDVHAALGTEPVDTDRLAFVAWLATRALAYAYTVAGREPPPGDVRVELTLPSGALWTFGPEDAPGRITGPAGQYCRVFTQRLRRAGAPDLKATGEVAESALAVARAYL
jgi:uncharacterized protein (TIGR03084 family)